MHHKQKRGQVNSFSLSKAGPYLPGFLSPVKRFVPSQAEFPFKTQTVFNGKGMIS